MINVSNAYKMAIRENRIFHVDIKINLTDQETVLSVAKKDLLGLSIEDNVSGTNSFDIGAAIINQVTLKLDNTDGRYDNYSFDGAQVIVKIGLQIGESIEWLDKGIYISDPGEDTGAVLTLKACDFMSRFDRNYKDSTLAYPATLGDIVRDACSVCGVSLATASFDGDDHVVQKRPGDNALTFREVLCWVGQISCHWCRCNTQGQLELGFYDLDGYEDDSGTCQTIDRLMQCSISTDDIVITGVKVTQEQEGENGVESTDYLSGTEGYVLGIEGNGLIQDSGQTIAGQLGEKLIGLRFRKLSVSHQSDPSIEAGDIAKVIDRKGNTYKTLITGTNFQLGSSQKTECSAESPRRNSSDRFSQQTQNYVKLRDQIQLEKSEREKAIEDLANSLAKSSGLYISEEKQDDGSSIFYLHDKPTLSESQNIIKITAEAIGVSNDGGKTYPYGFKLTGEMITKLLYAEGINADYITSGAFTVKDKSGKVIFQANISTGQVTISGDHVTIGSQTASEAIQDALDKAQSAEDAALSARNMIIALSNDYQSIPVDSDGNYTNFPECKTTVTVTYGSVDITSECVISIEKSSAVTGTWDNATKTYTVTGLSADSAWIDIKATYLSAMVKTKRFSVAKLYAGKDGNIGPTGPAGEDGISVTGSVVTYQVASSGTSIPAGTWQSSVPSVSAGQYLWTRTQFNYSDGSHTYSYSVSRMGQNGSQGPAGSDGKGIQSISNYYLATTVSSGVTTSTSGWTTTIQTITTSKKYLWNYEKITYTDGSSTNTSPCIIGVYGNTGETGPAGSDGKNGAEGNGISSITEYYAVSTSNSTAPTSWSTTVPTMTTTNKYLWNYETIKYTNGISVDTSKRVIGVYGNTGATGPKGETGNGIESTTITYQASSSGTVIPTGSWSDSVPSVSPGQYLWTRTVTHYTDNTQTISYSVAKSGSNGIDGRVYFLESNTTVIKAGNETMNPSFIQAIAYYRSGTSTSKTQYSGRFKVEESYNGGESWETIYISSQNESKIIHSLYSFLTDDEGNALTDDDGYGIAVYRDISLVRISLYAAGGTTVLIDQQIYTVVKDVDSLTHDEIFALLTNNGQIKGIYKEGDQLYISFTFAKGGQLTLGGAGNGNGVLVMLDGNNQEVGHWNNSSWEMSNPSSGRSVRMIDGNIYLLLNDIMCGRIGAFRWGNNASDPEGTTYLTNQKYLGIGHYLPSGTAASDIVINNGLNPDGVKDRIIYRGTERHQQDNYFDQSAYFNTIGSIKKIGDKNTYSGTISLGVEGNTEQFITVKDGLITGTYIEFLSK